MARVVIASSADADYAEVITDVAAKAGWRTAAKYDELFERLYDRLADHPGSGAPRPALGQNIRIGIVSPYIIIYRNDDVSNTAGAAHRAQPPPDHRPDARFSMKKVGRVSTAIPIFLTVDGQIAVPKHGHVPRNTTSASTAFTP